LFGGSGQVISFDGMENAEGGTPMGFICVKQNEDKPSCAEDTKQHNRQNLRMAACSVVHGLQEDDAE
jgi:hypothetical protein